MLRLLFQISCLSILALYSTLSYAQSSLPQAIEPIDNKRTRILFLLDASGSMQSKWGTGNSETRMHSAKRILTEMIALLDKRTDMELALRAYGHQSMLTEKNCKDTQLEVGFSRS